MSMPEQSRDQHHPEEVGREMAIAQDLNTGPTLETEGISAAFGAYLSHIRQLGKVERIITISSPDPMQTFHMVGVLKGDNIMEGNERLELVRVAENLKWTLAGVRDVCISHIEPSRLDSYLGMLHSSLHSRTDLTLTSYPILDLESQTFLPPEILQK